MHSTFYLSRLLAFIIVFPARTFRCVQRHGRIKMSQMKKQFQPKHLSYRLHCQMFRYSEGGDNSHSHFMLKETFPPNLSLSVVVFLVFAKSRFLFSVLLLWQITVSSFVTKSVCFQRKWHYLWMGCGRQASDWLSGEASCDSIRQDHSHNKYKAGSQIPTTCFVILCCLMKDTNVKNVGLQLESIFIFIENQSAHCFLDW